MIKIKILRWEDYLDYACGLNLIIRVILRRGGRRVRGDVTKIEWSQGCKEEVNQPQKAGRF